MLVGFDSGKGEAFPFQESLYLRIGKRACDVVLSLAALPLVFLVFLFVAPIIYFEDKGPIFYNAPRVGKHGKEFVMYKFRSMKVNSPDLLMSDGSTYNGADDPRMTRIGAFLRKTSLDEFPQFLNVLKGDMSIIGPRPDLKREVELYQGYEKEKLLVKPGVSGYAAAYGRNSLPLHDRLRMDVHYVHHVSFLFDAKIFFRTIITVFSQDGVFVKEENTSGDS